MKSLKSIVLKDHASGNSVWCVLHRINMAPCLLPWEQNHAVWAAQTCRKTYRQMRWSQATRGAAARSSLMNSKHLCYGMASACLGLHRWAPLKGRNLRAFPFSSNEGLLASFFDSIRLIVFKITCSFQTVVRQDSCAQMKWLWAWMLTTGLIFCLSSLCAQWPCWWIF